MDNRPIGVFDSGLGGITAVRELVRVLPREDVIYFGDTGRVPYGGRSTETILKYTRQDVRFLCRFDIKAILVACGTASTVVPMLDSEKVPVVSVIEPAAQAAVRSTRSGRVGIIATEASIASGAYQRALEATGDFKIFAKSCPLFVPLVENGRTEPDDIVVSTVAREYLQEVADFGCDTLIMGCTHYPLLRRVLESVLPGVTLIDAGAAAAEHLRHILERGGLLAERAGRGATDYYVSDDPSGFSRKASMFLGSAVSADANKVDIENY